MTWKLKEAEYTHSSCIHDSKTSAWAPDCRIVRCYPVSDCDSLRKVVRTECMMCLDSFEQQSSHRLCYSLQPAACSLLPAACFRISHTRLVTGQWSQHLQMKKPPGLRGYC